MYQARPAGTASTKCNKRLFLLLLACLTGLSSAYATESDIQTLVSLHLSQFFFDWMHNTETTQLFGKTVIAVTPNLGTIRVKCQSSDSEKVQSCLSQALHAQVCRVMQTSATTNCDMPNYTRLLLKNRKALQVLQKVHPSSCFFKAAGITRHHFVPEGGNTLSENLLAVIQHQVSGLKENTDALSDEQLLFVLLASLFVFNEEQLINDAFLHLDIKLGLIKQTSSLDLTPEQWKTYSYILAGAFSADDGELYLSLNHQHYSLFIQRIQQETHFPGWQTLLKSTEYAVGIALFISIANYCLSTYRAILNVRRLQFRRTQAHHASPV